MCVASLSLMAQGRMSFGNNAGGVSAPIRDAGGPVTIDSSGTHNAAGAGTGTLADGGLYKAQMYWSLVNAADGAGFIAVTNNSVGIVAGFTGTGTKTFALPATTTIFAQMRAWKLADGATYEIAFAANGTVGFSAVVPVILTVSPTPANFLTGITAFEVGQVPEPSTIALGIVGLLGAFFIRRRK